MANAPIVSWYEGTNAKASEVKSTVNYGTVDADSPSPIKEFWIWNNRGGTEDCSKMEEVVFTTRDRQGGQGDTQGNEVEAVKDCWFQVKVDTLGETSYTPVGKAGINPQNMLGTKALGTNGVTTNVNASGAPVWSANTPYGLNTFVQPTTPNGFIYKVVKAGTTDGTDNSSAWVKVEGNSVYDGTVEYQAIQIEKTPASQEILGLANNTDATASNEALAGGNFVKISVFAEVPITASAGKNLLVKRVKIA